MGLDLEIATLAGPGRLKKPLEVSFVRELETGDLEQLAAQPLGSVAPPVVKRLSDRHHQLARLLATGTPEADCALITGYSASRISILKSDPAFLELQTLYSAEAKREFVQTYEHMAGLARDAVLLLRDRIEDDPDKFSTNELLKVSTEMTDRTANLGDSVDLPDLIELVVPAEAKDDHRAD